MTVAPPRSMAEIREKFRSDQGFYSPVVLESIDFARGARHDLRAMTCVVEESQTPEPSNEPHPSEMVHLDKPLRGIPVVVKDSFHVAGLPRWHGSAIHPGHLSPVDSAPVARLREAGAVLVGKTAMSELGLIASGNNSQFGDTLNPWNTAMSPGGSSSGTAAAIAYGVTPVGLGTDIAGSVRLPAAQCGIVGFKPTQGAIPYAPASNWRSAGPMATTVADVRTIFDVVSRTDDSDQWSFAYDVGESSARATGAQLQGLRVGVIEWPGYGPQMDAETRGLFERFLGLLSGAGAYLSEYRPGLSDADFMELDLCLKTRCEAEVRSAAAERRSMLLPAVAQWASSTPARSAVDYYDSLERLSARAVQLLAASSGFDLMVSPIMGIHQFPADQFGPDTTMPLLYHTNYTAWFNQTGQPALSLCMGFSASGMPIGVQLIGRRRTDQWLLDIGEQVEELLSVTRNWPTISQNTRTLTGGSE
ncbi:amidase [Kocuria rosea]|nr:amidase [Kocuria rosea]THE19486.1 amidase [Kocuria rosea]